MGISKNTIFWIIATWYESHSLAGKRNHIEDTSLQAFLKHYWVVKNKNCINKPMKIMQLNFAKVPLGGALITLKFCEQVYRKNAGKQRCVLLYARWEKRKQTIWLTLLLTAGTMHTHICFRVFEKKLPIFCSVPWRWFAFVFLPAVRKDLWVFLLPIVTGTCTHKMYDKCTTNTPSRKVCFNFTAFSGIFICLFTPEYCSRTPC